MTLILTNTRKAVLNFHCDRQATQWSFNDCSYTTNRNDWYVIARYRGVGFNYYWTHCTPSDTERLQQMEVDTFALNVFALLVLLVLLSMAFHLFFSIQTNL